MPELDVDKYRKVVADLEEARDSIQQLEGIKTEMEKEVFAELDVGETLVFDEFEFKVSEGRRGFYPQSGFEIKWNNLIYDSPWAIDEPLRSMEQTKLSGLVVEMTTYKGPTLGKLEKMLSENDFIRDHWGTIKEIFGYKAGSRVEKVNSLVPQHNDSIVDGSEGE